jgi:hypothetical protein
MSESYHRDGRPVQGPPLCVKFGLKSGESPFPPAHGNLYSLRKNTLGGTFQGSPMPLSLFSSEAGTRPRKEARFSTAQTNTAHLLS